MKENGTATVLVPTATLSLRRASGGSLASSSSTITVIASLVDVIWLA